jgi:hypothetical protein
MTAVSIELEADTALIDACAAKIRRMVASRIYGGDEAGQFPSVQRIVSLLANIRADRVPEAITAHKLLVREVRGDLVDGGTTWPEHVKLVVLLHEYIELHGYTYYMERRQWENHDLPTGRGRDPVIVGRSLRETARLLLRKQAVDRLA